MSFTGEDTPGSLFLAELNSPSVEAHRLVLDGIITYEELYSYLYKYLVLRQEVNGQEITVKAQHSTLIRIGWKS